MDNLVSQMAEMIIEQNRAMVGNDVANDAIGRVRAEKEQENNKKEGGTEENVQEKTKRRRTTKSKTA